MSAVPWPARGKLITLEGGEGAGKTTQARLLAERLRGRGIETLVTREPGGAPGAERIRELLVEGAPGKWDAETEALLHFAARRVHLVEVIWPALDRGAWVVSDRFADSTMAYQGYGMGLGRGPIERLYTLAVGDFAPDLTLVLDLPVAVGLARVAARGKANRYDAMGKDFHERLRVGYLEIARGAPARCVVVDAGGDVEAVAARLFGVVEARFRIGEQGK